MFQYFLKPGLLRASSRVVFFIFPKLSGIDGQLRMLPFRSMAIFIFRQELWLMASKTLGKLVLKYLVSTTPQDLKDVIFLVVKIRSNRILLSQYSALSSGAEKKTDFVILFSLCLCLFN